MAGLVSLPLSLPHASYTADEWHEGREAKEKRGKKDRGEEINHRLVEMRVKAVQGKG